MLTHLTHFAVFVLGGALATAGVVETLPHSSDAAPQREISILVDSVARPAMHDAIAAFESAHPGVVVDARFAGSRVIAEQLRLGAQPDAVVLPSREARAAGTMLSGVTPAFSDHTAIVVSMAARERIRDAGDLARPGVRLGVGRAGTALSELDDATAARLAYAQPPDFRDRLAANVAEEEHDTQRGSLVDAIAAGTVDAAIMFASDVVPGKSVEVALPPSVRITRSESAAVVRGTANAQLARAFVEMLGSSRGAAIFKAHGHDES
ncbi:MAG: molybdate transporter substrate-binding protein [Candidatus Eremiobacteraeota bacterium]|jgi:molybdate transport system substrate-binding protein|nr:molybdate transporter substrate-binding protein [Candidatus Eremiobacteraeota bacterium]